MKYTSFTEKVDNRQKGTSLPEMYSKLKTKLVDIKYCSENYLANLYFLYY